MLLDFANSFQTSLVNFNFNFLLLIIVRGFFSRSQSTQCEQKQSPDSSIEFAYFFREVSAYTPETYIQQTDQKPWL